jgi:hypothetical protein
LFHTPALMLSSSQFNIQYNSSVVVVVFRLVRKKQRINYLLKAQYCWIINELKVCKSLNVYRYPSISYSHVINFAIQLSAFPIRLDIIAEMYKNKNKIYIDDMQWQNILYPSFEKQHFIIIIKWRKKSINMKLAIAIDSPHHTNTSNTTTTILRFDFYWYDFETTSIELRQRFDANDDCK